MQGTTSSPYGKDFFSFDMNLVLIAKNSSQSYLSQETLPAHLCTQNGRIFTPALRILYTLRIEPSLMNKQYMTLFTNFNLGKYTTFCTILPVTSIFFFVNPVVQRSVIPRDSITLNKTLLSARHVNCVDVSLNMEYLLREYTNRMKILVNLLK